MHLLWSRNDVTRHVLRDDSGSYGDIVESLAYLLLFKSADERSRPPCCQPNPFPVRDAEHTLSKKYDDELFDLYRHELEAPGSEKCTPAMIFNKAQYKFQGPAKQRRVIVNRINDEDGSSMDVDVKGNAYADLAGKYAQNAQDTNPDAGQHFTLRPLFHVMVNAVAPRPCSGTLA